MSLIVKNMSEQTRELGCGCGHAFRLGSLSAYVECPRCGETESGPSLAMTWWTAPRQPHSLAN